VKSIIEQTAICVAFVTCLTAMCSPNTPSAGLTNPPIVDTKPTTTVAEHDAVSTVAVPSEIEPSSIALQLPEPPPPDSPPDPQPAFARGQPVYQYQYTPRRRLFGGRFRR
jgi:hypothetical protein